MIICSALYYPGSLEKGDLIVRDNRLYVGKYAETFPLWWGYLRKHYPDVNVHLFADIASPVPVRPLLAAIKECWWEGPALEDGTHVIHNDPDGSIGHNANVTVTWLDQYAGGYFRPMQRNLVEAIKLAYRLNEDLFWLDSDAFLNTDIRPLIEGADVAAPEIAHHQMTMDSVCTFISAKRLRALEGLGIDLPSFLDDMLANGPTETRMHTLQEGGLYKLFAYGKAVTLAGQIEMTHLSCYDHFMGFLERNPLDTPEYWALFDGVAAAVMLNQDKLKGVEMSFHDMDYRITKEAK